MARYIDADELTDEIKSLKISMSGKDIFPDRAKESVLRIIDEQPTADVEEVKHGYWKEIKTGEKLYDYCFKCSNCNKETPPNSFVVSPDYCPNCGAKMDGERK